MILNISKYLQITVYLDNCSCENWMKFEQSLRKVLDKFLDKVLDKVLTYWLNSYKIVFQTIY